MTTNPEIVAAEGDVSAAHDRVMATVAAIKHRVDPRVLAHDAFGRTAAQAQRMAGDAAETAQRMAGDAADTAQRLAGDAKVQANRLAGDAATLVRDKPWTVAAGTTAALVALALGLRFTGRRDDDQDVSDIAADNFEPLDRRQV